MRRRFPRRCASSCPASARPIRQVGGVRYCAGLPVYCGRRPYAGDNDSCVLAGLGRVSMLWQRCGSQRRTQSNSAHSVAASAEKSSASIFWGPAEIFLLPPLAPETAPCGRMPDHPLGRPAPLYGEAPVCAMQTQKCPPPVVRRRAWLCQVIVRLSTWSARMRAWCSTSSNADRVLVTMAS